MVHYTHRKKRLRISTVTHYNTVMSWVGSSTEDILFHCLSTECSVIFPSNAGIKLVIFTSRKHQGVRQNFKRVEEAFPQEENVNKYTKEVTKNLTTKFSLLETHGGFVNFCEELSLLSTYVHKQSGRYTQGFNQKKTNPKIQYSSGELFRLLL